jgi:quinol monooxygenase YgiN
MIATATLLCLQAKHGQQHALEDLLRNAAPAVRDDATVRSWVATRTGRHDYGIFATFPDAAARDAHLDSPFHQQFMREAGLLLEEGAVMENLEVIAQKLPSSLPPQPDLKALLLTFKAQVGRTGDVEEFLRDAQPFIEEETETTAWFAIRFESGAYGVFDTFPDNGARLKHLVGHVPRELAKNALTLLGSMPDMEMMEVIAQKVVILR